MVLDHTILIKCEFTLNTFNYRRNTLMVKLENEIRKNYDFACRKIILDYILMDSDELKRIGIKNYYRPDYSSMLIRGPVPWHHMTIIHKERLIHNLYIFRESILMLGKVWKK